MCKQKKETFQKKRVHRLDLCEVSLISLPSLSVNKELGFVVKIIFTKELGMLDTIE